MWARMQSRGDLARQCQNKAPSLTVGVPPLRLASLKGRTPSVSAGVDRSSAIRSSFDTAAALSPGYHISRPWRFVKL